MWVCRLLAPSIRSFSTKVPPFDCYKALGVARSASASDIKIAYRTLAKKHHPDFGGSNEAFIKVQQAYEALIDNRALHDATHKSTATSSSRSSQSGPSSNAQWSGWAETSWWKKGSQTEEDDLNFEDLWKRMKRNKGFQKAKANSFDDSDDDEDEEYRSNRKDEHRKAKRRNNQKSYQTDSDGEDEDSWFRGKQKRDQYGKNPFRRPKKYGDSENYARPNSATGNVKHTELSDKVEVLGKGTFTGEYVRILDYNGRAAYQINREYSAGHKKNLAFIFWSSKFHDWKLSHKLKDDGNCIAFNEDFRVKNPADLRLPWFIWNEKLGEYSQGDIKVRSLEPDEDPVVKKEKLQSWSVGKLLQYIEKKKIPCVGCVEKRDLIEAIIQFEGWSGEQSSGASTEPKNSVQIASRARVDSVHMPPPSIRPDTKIHSNKVEQYDAEEENVPEWIVKNGDRKRYYGVFVNGEFHYGLIWDHEESQWVRVITQQVRKPLFDEE